MFSQIRSQKTRHLRQSNADEFIIIELRNFPFPERINNYNIIPLRRIYIIRYLADVVLRQRLVDFPESLVVYGNCDIKQLASISKLAPCNRLDALFFAFEHVIDDSHSIVDVGERHRRNMHTTRLLHQILDGNRAVAQAAI